VAWGRKHWQPPEGLSPDDVKAVTDAATCERDRLLLFFSRKHGGDGGLKAISRVQAWTILEAASELADVRVLALRASHQGAVGEPAPAHTCSATLLATRRRANSRGTYPSESVSACRLVAWGRSEGLHTASSDAEMAATYI
jgi:hypothetical protein